MIWPGTTPRRTSTAWRWRDRVGAQERKKGGGKTIDALRRGHWKILQDSPFAPRELYNLAADPRETTDLTKKEPAKFRDLAAALMRHIQRGGQVPWQAPSGGR